MKRNNSFDFIRHIAAYMVLFSHQFALSGIQEPIFFKWNTLGFIAVAIFFSISGYFMPKSFGSSENFIEFMIKRCKRIFPGLIACSLLMYFFIGFFFNTHSPSGYLLSGDALVKTLRNSVFIQEQIPGVFSDFKYKDVINGSLWTLPIEFLCYIIIGIFLSFSNSWKTPALLLCIAMISTVAINYWTDLYAYYSIPFKFFALFMIPFSFGALLSLTKDSWWKYRIKLILISCLMLAAISGKPEIQIIGLLCVSMLTIAIGLSINDRVVAGRFDVSYGIYIYAFPAQQIVINTLTDEFYISLVISIVITTVLAVVSYKYVELPFLKREFKYPERSTEN
ncbi:acyltransferase [Buttiauxella sp. B2]|uniref:acyltransferase family protein n=1 Tax=Buttiauxella sp. B2 TaxID=2587812 RepID=UPI00111D4D07|nr:acyltransferase [Buttiauxella sp. B2]TNV22131.1 acyltransferase [Buttiauxella sp. B2]